MGQLFFCFSVVLDYLSVDRYVAVLDSCLILALNNQKPYVFYSGYKLEL